MLAMGECRAAQTAALGSLGYLSTTQDQVLQAAALPGTDVNPSCGLAR
jgi:hypothetical protein